MAESISDYYEQAKAIAKIERELDVEQWVKIQLWYEPDDRPLNKRLLYEYDLPRDLAERRDWVIRWRRAKLQCKNPHGNICENSIYYRKVKGYTFGMQEDLDRFISAKAQLTRQQRVVSEYRHQQKQKNDMFYNEADDELLQKALAKLDIKRQNITKAEARLVAKVEEYKQQTL